MGANMLYEFNVLYIYYAVHSVHKTSLAVGPSCERKDYDRISVCISGSGSAIVTRWCKTLAFFMAILTC